MITQMTEGPLCLYWHWNGEDPEAAICGHSSCYKIVRELEAEENLPDHKCPKQAFLDDPITQAYGVGSEMVGLISCSVCDSYQA